MPLWSSESLRDVYLRLLERGVEFIVIGGQAVNLWSDHYSQQSDLPASDWQRFEPFSSHDLDCLGGSTDALDAGDAFGVEVELYPPFGRTTGPNSGSMMIPINEHKLLIHFIHTPWGASPDEVRRTALLLSIEGEKALFVMHPVLCLETKIACLFHLDQRSRHDLKHVQMSCLNFHEFVRERLKACAAKDVLAAAERVGRIACTQDGLRLWQQHSVACESFLPIDAIRTASSAEPKFIPFLALRWPIIETKIRDRRKRFLSIVEAAAKAPPGSRKPDL